MIVVMVVSIIHELRFVIVCICRNIWIMIYRRLNRRV